MEYFLQFAVSTFTSVYDLNTSFTSGKHTGRQESNAKVECAAIEACSFNTFCHQCWFIHVRVDLIHSFVL